MSVFPPHVHPFAWGIAVASAALMGLLAAPIGRMGPVGAWLGFPVAGALVINLATAFQQLQAARALALWGAYLCVFIYCLGLRTDPAEGAAVGTKSGSGARLVLGAVALAGTSLAAHGLYQSLYAFERLAVAAQELGLPEAVRARIGSGRAVATFGLPDALSGLLAISLPITFSLARAGTPDSSRRAVLYALAIVQGAGLVATWSAGGLASLALASAAVLWWRGRIGKGAPGRRRAVALVAIGLVGAALLLAARLRGSGSSAEGNPLSLREGNWMVAMEVASEHPLFGVGAGCYGIAFPPHRVWGMNESQFAHSSYLQLFSEMGLPIGSLALIAAGLLAWRLLEGGASASLAAACLAFLVHNSVDFTFYVPSVGLTFFCVTGLAVGHLGGASHARTRRGAGRALVSVAALGLAAFAVMVTRADVKREAAREAVLEGNLALASSLAADAVSCDPFDPESRSFLSHLQLDQGTRAGDATLLRKSEEGSRRAVELDPRTPHHWNHLGRVLLALGDTQGAYIAMARAVQLYPIKTEYRQDRDEVGSALSSKAGKPREPR